MNTHIWYNNPQWEVDKEGDEFAVNFNTNEVMRLGSDGSLYVGKLTPYMFKTREWAQFCADRLNSLDRAFGKQTSGFSITGGNLGIGTSTVQHTFYYSVQSRQDSAPVPILTTDNHNRLTYVNVPYIVGVWLRSTTVWRGLKRLWYGERYDH